MKEHGFLLSGGEFATIDVPGAALTRVNGINARGDIVGRYDIAAQGKSEAHGFLLSAGQFTTLDFPGSSFTAATAINSRGEIVGDWSVGGKDHGFLLGKVQ
jgi:uncharacterized membrane protein